MAPHRKLIGENTFTVVFDTKHIKKGTTVTCLIFNDILFLVNSTVPEKKVDHHFQYSGLWVNESEFGEAIDLFSPEDTVVIKSQTPEELKKFLTLIQEQMKPILKGNASIYLWYSFFQDEAMDSLTRHVEYTFTSGDKYAGQMNKGKVRKI